MEIVNGTLHNSIPYAGSEHVSLLRNYTKDYALFLPARQVKHTVFLLGRQAKYSVLTSGTLKKDIQ